MARRLRLRSAGHPTDATMGSTVSAALGYRCSLPQDEATRGGPHRLVLLTNQRTLVREELVGRTDHQRHGRVRALGVVTAAAGAIRAGGDHSRPPSPAWTCTSSDTSRSARRAASTRPSEASGPMRRRAGLMLHPRRSAESTLSTRRRTASRGPADQGSGAPRHLPRPTAEWQQDPPGSAEVLLPPRVYVEGPSETAHYRHAHHHALTSQPLPRIPAPPSASPRLTATASSPPPAAAAKVRNQRRQARRRGLEQGRRSRQPDGWCDVLWVSGRRCFYH